MSRNAVLLVALWAAVSTVVVVVKAVKVVEIRQLVSEDKVSCVLVFGDSSVDPGNNNRLPTTVKSNFSPYGKDFIDGRATGRFCDGRLATDFVAEALGRRKALAGFLDPNLKKEDLMNGVSFASAGSGYDDLTANLSEVLTITKQLEYMRHYKLHLGAALGGMSKAEAYVRKATFILSLGSNDLLQNYFVEPTRPKQFTLPAYQNLLVSSLRTYIQEMHKLGARRVVVVGVPNLGCMPIARTLAGSDTECAESYNKAASSLNSKIEKTLLSLQITPGIKTVFIDVYKTIERAINNPKDYGFTETSKGCCGTGTYEYGDTCKGLTTCEEPKKYIFWDAVHPSQRMYEILSQEILESLSYDFLL
ncbi:hypothetical protein V2J09_017002 [Rumex salicifolius]